MYILKRYTSKYIGVLLNTELQYCTFVDVFYHKASYTPLKEMLVLLGEQARNHRVTLHYLMEELLLSPTDTGSEGLRGIFREAFYMIEDTEDDELVDEMMIFSLIQAAYFKLSYYQHILDLFRQKGLKLYIQRIEDIISVEEEAIAQLKRIQNELQCAKFGKITEEPFVIC